MSSGNDLISSIVSSDDRDSLLAGVVKPECLTPFERLYYSFVEEHLREHGVFPSTRTVEEAGFEITETTEPASYYAKKVRDRFAREKLVKTVEAAREQVGDDPIAAIERIVGELAPVILDGQHYAVSELRDAATMVLDNFWATKRGDDPYFLKFPWPTMTAVSDGGGAGDFITIVGRTGAGKTMLLLFIAILAWKQYGLNIAVVSMEMMLLPIAQRIISLVLGLPLSGLRRGAMSTKEVGVLQSFTADGTDAKFYIIDGRGKLETTDIDQLARVLSPDALFVDGAYLVRLPQKEAIGKKRDERIASVANYLKQDIATSHAIPVIASYQLNRDSVRARKLDASHVAGSDEIPQLSTVCLAVQAEEQGSIENSVQRVVTVIKGRNGEDGIEFTINWNFKGMNFLETEVGTSYEFI